MEVQPGARIRRHAEGCHSRCLVLSDVQVPQPVPGDAMQRLGVRNGIHVQRPDVTGFRTTGLRGIGASGMPLIPLEYCQTPKCTGKPVIRATDRNTRLAYCLECWPVGNA